MKIGNFFVIISGCYWLHWIILSSTDTRSTQIHSHTWSKKIDKHKKTDPKIYEQRLNKICHYIAAIDHKNNH